MVKLKELGFVAVLGAVVLLPGTSNAQEIDAVRADATAYAERYGVDIEEAVTRLLLQESVGKLNVQLLGDESEVFGGLYIQHEPSFRVVVAFTDPIAERRLSRRVAGGALAQWVDVRRVEHSYEMLRAAQAATLHVTNELGIAADSSINIYENRVELMIEEDFPFKSALNLSGRTLPDSVAIIPVPELSQLEMDLEGGRALTTCTTGFGVENLYGGLGMLTAGHCGNAQSYSGTSLSFVSQLLGGSHDVQWHMPSAFAGLQVRNRIFAGTTTRPITATRGRNAQSVGEWVCKQGMTTGMTCGTITSTSFRPTGVRTHNATFVFVDGGNTNLSEGGDSGGPWFVGNTAYGVHKCGSGNDSCYMPINFASDLGVTVLTEDPVGPPPPPSATLSCFGNYSGSGQVTCVANVTGGTTPLSYSWTYSGTADSHSFGGSYGYAYYYGSGCNSSDVNFFHVQVTDADGRTDTASMGSLPCF